MNFTYFEHNLCATERKQEITAQSYAMWSTSRSTALAQHRIAINALSVMWELMMKINWWCKYSTSHAFEKKKIDMLGSVVKRGGDDQSILQFKKKNDWQRIYQTISFLIWITRNTQRQIHCIRSIMQHFEKVCF